MPQQAQPNSYIIDGQVIVSLSINNAPVPLSPEVIIYLSIVQNARQLLPTLQLELLDVNGSLLRAFPVSDGTPIDINVQRLQGQQAATWRFLAFGVPRAEARTTENVIKIFGILDAPRYVYSMVDTSYMTTSAGAIQQIATYCGLTAQVDISNDSMVWLPNRMSFGHYCHWLAQRGWASNSSAFLVGVDVDKKLHYRDVVQLANQPVQSIYLQGSVDDQERLPQHLITQLKITSASGLGNRFAGYGMQSGQVGLDGVHRDLQDVTVARFSPKTEINTVVKDSVGLTRALLFPPEAGNTHVKYSQALHQNKRILATYGLRIEVMVDNVTVDQLFDTVQLNMLDPTTYKPNTLYNGKYFIVAKAIVVSGTYYAEKLVLCGQGKSSDPTGTLT